MIDKRDFLVHLGNALLLGGIVFFTAFLDGVLTKSEIITAIGASMISIFTQVSQYLKNDGNTTPMLFRII